MEQNLPKESGWIQKQRIEKMEQANGEVCDKNIGMKIAHIS